MGNLRKRVEEQQAELDLLKKELAELKKGQKDVKAEQSALKEDAEESNKLVEWTKRIKLKGDFRYRHELIDVEDRRDRN